MQSDNERYFEQRAQEELDLAQQATTPEATEAHYQLANLYLERVQPEDAAEVRDEEAAEPDQREGRRMGTAS